MVLTRYRNAFLLCVALVVISLITYHHDTIRHASFPAAQQENPKPAPPSLKYKPKSPVLLPPVVENFPLAAAARSASDLPPIPEWNTPPSDHVPEKTPLFIGFTRNWRVLQQCVVSYITAGWPAEDIYVIENTGVMNSNQKGLLSLQNPFFLNHTRLSILGVNVITTPTLLTFAQLQNFYISTAIEKNWSYYFWSHMDVVALSHETRYEDVARADSGPPDIAKEPAKWKSLYANCIDTLRKVLAHPIVGDDAPKGWGMRFFSYDRLALVNVAAFVDIGAWDTMIPFYMTDCDMHWRIAAAGYSVIEETPGHIYDVASSLDDLIVLYRKTGTSPSGVEIPEASFTDPNEVEKKLDDMKKSEDELAAASRTRDLTAKGGVHPRDESSLNEKSPSTSLATWQADDPYPSPSPRLLTLFHTLEAMGTSKHSSTGGRNTWQGRAKGGEGDPFYRDSAGFEQAIQMTITHGRQVFAEKWGHRDCDLGDTRLKPSDAWLVEHDW